MRPYGITSRYCLHPKTPWYIRSIPRYWRASTPALIRHYAQLLPDGPDCFQLPPDTAPKEVYGQAVLSADMMWNKYVQEEVKSTLESISDAENFIEGLEIELKELRENCDHHYILNESRTSSTCKWCQQVRMESPVK